MGEILVVQSKIKAQVKKAGLRTGADFVRVLSKKVEEITDKAIARVKAEGKKITLGAEDVLLVEEAPKVEAPKPEEPAKPEDPLSSGGGV
jgi:hypothetical protein